MSERETAGEEIDHKALSEVEDLVPVVCSECGVSYMAGVTAGQGALVCPQCGPSIPIDETPQRRRALKFRRPRIRLSLGLLQFLVLALTFAVFLGIVLSTLNAQRGSKKPLSTDAIVQRMLGKQPAPLRQASNVRSSLFNSDTSTTDAPKESETGATLAARDSNKSVDDDAASNADVDRSPATRDPVTAAARGDTLRPIEDELVMTVAPPLPDNNVTIKYVMENAERLRGRQVTLLCRLVAIHDDAQDRVPNRFEVDGTLVRLSSEEELNFRRLEVRDVDGRMSPDIYLKDRGELAKQFAWLQPEDWVVLTVTPGQKMRPPGQPRWGLIVTRVAPAAAVVQVPTATIRRTSPTGIATRPGR